MNFEDTAQEAAFRAEARAWIAANAPGHVPLDHGALLAASRAWQAKKAAAGYACLTWPADVGGGGQSQMDAVIWRQEEGALSALSAVFAIGHGMCGPTLMLWGSDADKAARLPPMIDGREIWCQLFSEPAAGSDVAGLRTRARRGSGDDWSVNGQKIWTSGAHYADWGLLLARTDPSVAKHKGLTMFFVDMKSPGIEVRRIRQANGEMEFNEVYFTDVTIPDGQRLGAVGQGWPVSVTTLMNERMSIGATIVTGFEAMLDHACQSGAIVDRAVRSRMAQWAVRDSGVRYTAMRGLSALSRGDVPGPEISIAKLAVGQMKQDMIAFLLDGQGVSGMLVDPGEAPADGLLQAMLLKVPGMRIAGGTDEILRNIIAERVLGLPPEPRVDKDVPFDQIPVSGR